MSPSRPPAVAPFSGLRSARFVPSLLLAAAALTGACRGSGAGSTPGAAAPPDVAPAVPVAPQTPPAPPPNGLSLPPQPPPLPPPGYLDERPAFFEPGETTAVVGSTFLALSASRGLQLFDLAAPGLIGRLPLPGIPHALLVAGPVAYVVMAGSPGVPATCPGCPAQVRDAASSLVAAVDVSDPRAPRVRASFRVEGKVVATHREGAELFLVLRRLPVSRGTTTVLALDVSDPTAPRERARLQLPGPAWVDAVHFAPGTAYLGLYGGHVLAGDRCQPIGGYQLPAGAEGCTQLVAVDLAAMTAGASLALGGRVTPGAADHHQGVMRIVVVPNAESSNARVHTIASRRAGELTALATLDLPSRSGTLLFDGARAYVTVGAADNPVQVVDLSRPARPWLGRPVQGVGYVARTLTGPDGSVITWGQEPGSSFCADSEVARFDPSDPDRPRLLARVTFPSDFGPYQRPAVAGDLLAVPFWTAVADRALLGLPPAGLQLFDLDLRRRGQTPLAVVPHQLVRSADHLVAVGPQRAQLLDVRDRDRPATRADFDLARPVTDLRLAGDATVQLAYDDDQREFHVHLVPADDADSGPTLATATFDGLPGPLFAADRFVYLFWTHHGRTGDEPRMDVLEVAGNQLRRRGGLSLEGAPLLERDEPDGDATDLQIKQVAGTTLLVPLQRQPDCHTPVVRPVAVPPSCPARDALRVSSADQIPTPPLPPPSPGCTDGDFLVIDVAAPDQPRIASRIRLAGGGHAQTILVRDRRVLVGQAETGIGQDGRAELRYAASEVDLTDVDHPRISAPVPTPGAVVAERPADGTWFTAATILPRPGQPGGVLVQAFPRTGPDRDPRSSQLALSGGVSGPIADSNALYFTVNGALLAIDLRGPDAPRLLSTTPIPGATFSGSLTAENPGPGGTLPPVAADVHRAVAGHVTVLLLEESSTATHRAQLIYDVTDPAHPRLLDRATITFGRRPIVRLAPGNRLMVPRGDGGVDLLNL
jgi:hypothetical protein